MDKTGQFIKQAKEIHGDKYDYSKSEYINSKSKILIICKVHGEFEQEPRKHLEGQRCKKCTIQKQRFTTEQFTEKAKEKHGDTYDYSISNYINYTTKVSIQCKQHGIFEQKPQQHLDGNGCPKCGGKIITNTEEFIKRSREFHGDTYNYSKTIYKTAKEKVIIICNKHGEFKQDAFSHSKGVGCPICGLLKSANSRKSNTDEFIEKAKEVHGDNYDYLKVDYIGVYNKIIIICKIHGEFEQTPHNHLNGNGCPICGIEQNAINQRSNTTQFIEKAREIHEDNYDYLKVHYIDNRRNVIIICKIHGDFEQTPNNHLNGNGCPLCVNKTEAKLYKYIHPIYPTLQRQFKQEWCKRILHLPYDFCIPEHKIIIELDGPQHFQQIANWGSPEEQFENDKYKEDCANQNGYFIIRLLQEDVFYDTYDWVKELCNAIEEIKTSNEITNIYLCKNDEYDKY
jgi:very-short-patch-repair endonuclease